MTTARQDSHRGLADRQGIDVSANGLEVVYGKTRALAGVDIDVHRREVVALTGASGSGKSTLLHVLAGIQRPTTGEVRLDGRSLFALPDRARSALRLRDMGFVFQSADLVAELTLLENVALPLELCGTRPVHARRAAAERLEQLGIDRETAGRTSGSVSGGQAQRAAVARALVHRPQVIFADEPTGALDSTNGQVVLDALIAARDEGASVVLVTHDQGIARRADRQVVLRDGHVIA